MESIGNVQVKEEREAFITALMKEKFNRRVLRISRLGHNSNNFVCHLELDVPSTTHTVQTYRPGTSPLPAGELNAVMRISNPEALLNENVLVQNEVAAMSLMREALTGGELESLIPLVYDWAPSSEGGTGWILQEYKKGLQLDEALNDLDREKQRDVVRQVVSVYKHIQDYKLPESVKGYGGLAFNLSGIITTGETTIPCGGPFDTLADMYGQMLRRQLDESDTSDRIKGWRRDNHDLRDRLEHFALQGIKRQTRNNSTAQRVLMHGDYNAYNMLFDPVSNRLTAILDCEFAQIASPAEEYFYSFRTFGALLAGPFEEGDEGLLRTCLLEGFDGNIPEKPNEEDEVNWTIAVMMDEESSQAGLLRPIDIPGCGELAALHWFLQDISPPYFFMSRWLEGRKEEDVATIHATIEANLSKYLARWK